MAAIEQIKKYPIRVLKTLALYINLIALGLNNGIVGPTLLDLRILTQSSVSEIAYILPGRAAGFTVGSFVVGVLWTRVNVQLFLCACMFTSMMLTIGITLNRTLPGLIVTFFLNGICMGCLDAGSNMFLIDIWGKENPPFLQALHFAFGFGAFLAPLLATPYLLPKIDEDGEDIESNIRNIDTNVSDIDIEDVSTISNHTIYLPDDVKLIYPYGIISTLTLINALIFLTLFFKYRETPPHPSRIIEAPEESDNKTSASDNNSKFRILIIVLMTCFLLFYCGLEITYGSFLTTFAVNSAMKLKKATGALMTSCFWATFTFFRLFAVVYIDFTGPEINLIFEIILILISNVFLVRYGNIFEWSLWNRISFTWIGNVKCLCFSIRIH